MKQNLRTLIAGVVVGIAVGLVSGYGVAKLSDSHSSSAPTDVKSAWEEYVRAQKNYMAALTAQRGSAGQIADRRWEMGSGTKQMGDGANAGVGRSKMGDRSLQMGVGGGQTAATA